MGTKYHRLYKRQWEGIEKNVLKGEGMVQSEMQKRTRMKHIMLWNETREIKY